MRPVHAAPLALAFALAACGGGHDGETTPQPLRTSCDERTISGQCSHYAFTGAFAADDVHNVEFECGNAGGTLGVTCNPTDAVGKCTVVRGSTTTIEVWFYPPTFTLTAAGAMCTYYGGTWAAP
ncbi:MAG: hypothetical protein QM704_24565 [Anaeromyxobacteraceae bacterium]